MVELLRTKFFVPRSRLNLVRRPWLCDRLSAALDNKLILIAAPAGFGKTTLLSEWIPHSPRRVTWLSLDEGDNDPTRFWVYFIASLQALRPDLGAGALALLQTAHAPAVTSILTALINDLSAFPDPFSIVLDDYQVIESLPIHAALSYLIDHLPANMNLIITTRIDPPLPLARLRARDQLTELRANDLRFTPDEAAAFLSHVMGLSLSAQEAAALVQRTEGWIAGLHIAGLSLRGSADQPGFIRAFSGNHRHILEYLAQEVLDQQDQATHTFLLQTSILDRLCAPLCDAVTAGTGAQQILETLEQSNLFINPLDEDGRWYRYHHLFAEVLRARLLQTHGEEVSALHRRAAGWYAGQGMIAEAVHHELAGANFEQAARLIEPIAGDMLRKGATASLIRWLNALPEATLRAHPRLCLARGWTFLWGSEFSLPRADEWAQKALNPAAPGVISDPAIEGEIYALRALIAADRVDLPLSRELSQHALEYLPAGSPWRGVTTFCLGSVLYAAGEHISAVPVLTEALRLSREDGALYIQLIAANFLADIQVFQGRLGGAVEMYQQVLAWADPCIPQKGAVVAHAGLANVLCEQDQLDAALDHVHSGLAQLEQVGGPGAALWLYRSLARIQHAKGDLAAALAALDLAYESGQSARVPFVYLQAAALRARILLLHGDFEAAAVWAAASGLHPADPEASHPGLREVEYLTFARVLAAQGRHAAALSLLGRLLESAETDERLGGAIENLVLQSLVFQSHGDAAHARERLERALTLAEPRGYVRLFVDEGQPMRLLLAAYGGRLKNRFALGGDRPPLRLLIYIDKLLAAFSSAAPVGESPAAPASDPLSERELEILQLIATGRSNQEIAETLVIAVSTVKSHINHLYIKLGTSRRTQAVAIARDMGLLSG